ncbi:MAG: hypothetical protein HQ513_12860 [Rhodospirillales bacterium]|nr:hypothetical protein [Rhodospirillales bacterium]
MLKRILGLAVTFSAAAVLAACSSMTQYERQVENWEPVYCYKSIGAVQCYKEPKDSDSRRLVNFYGPAPSTYDKPDEPDYAAAKAPKLIDYWVKDPEPIPEANPLKVRVKNLAPAEAAEAPQTPLSEAQKEDVSFMDGLMRSIFGKPELANKPVAAASAPALTTPPVPAQTTIKPLASAAPQYQPAPAAQPVIAVETGTL